MNRQFLLPIQMVTNLQGGDITDRHEQIRHRFSNGKKRLQFETVTFFLNRLELLRCRSYTNIGVSGNTIISYSC